MTALRWPFRGKKWFRRLVLMGLINVVPIVGMMDLLGWTLACLDHVRTGREELPPAGFQYLRRGYPLFLVLAVYWLALTGVYAAVAVAGDFIGIALDGPAGIGYYISLVAITAMTPAIVLATDRAGIRAGLDLRSVMGHAWRHPRPAATAAALTLLLALLASLGWLVFGIGVLLTTAYTMPAWAAVTRRYELATA